MASTFAPRLVNGPFGDPGLFVELRWQGSAVLFDLGRNDGLPAADLLKVTHVFVSHTHMDHFIGFDRVLRLFLNRDKELLLFGPEGIRDCVAGKLAGYLKKQNGKSPMLVACDIYRPAAIDQLKIVGERVGVPVFERGQANPIETAKLAVACGNWHGKCLKSSDPAPIQTRGAAGSGAL